MYIHVYIFFFDDGSIRTNGFEEVQIEMWHFGVTFPKEFAKRPINAMVGSIKGLGVTPLQKFVHNFGRKQMQAWAGKHVTKLNDVANGIGFFDL